MDYFDELGGDALTMALSAFANLPRRARSEFLRDVAERMAPAILGRVAVEAKRVVIRGRYGVHVVRAELATDSGAFALRVEPRRALRPPDGGLVIQGPPSDPSRQLLHELPYGTGALVNRLLDSIAGHAASLSLGQDELVLAVPEPTRFALGEQPMVRLTSVAHLLAYIASEAEQRWPLDPNAPLRLPNVDRDVQPRAQDWNDMDDLLPPVPLYGIPPDAKRRR
jgi:hypothetical protein